MSSTHTSTQSATHGTAATVGVFDGVHRGHALLIGYLKAEAAKRHLQPMVVTFARHPQQVLAPERGLQLIMPLEARLQAIAQQGIDRTVALDFTAEFARLTSQQFIQLLHDDYDVRLLVMGFNHHFGHGGSSETFEQYVAQAAEIGVEVLRAPEYTAEFAPVSSTIVRRLIAEGQVTEAWHKMGHPFALSGTVVHGFHNGTGMGFPTANVGDIDPLVIMPPHGAYAVVACVQGRRLMGMANVGIRPTLDNGAHALSVEVNVFGVHADLYGEPIEVEFIEYLRPEMRFDGIDALRHQLEHDAQAARSALQPLAQTLNIDSTN